jgi:hypothetical protein
MTRGLPSRYDYPVADPSPPVSAASVVHPLDPEGHPPVYRPPDGSLPVGLESGSLVRPLLYQNVKSNAVRQRRSYDNPEMTPYLRSYLRSSQGYPEVVRSYVRQRSATLLFEMKPSYATPEFAAIALTRCCWGVLRDPACVASATSGYGPAVGSARALLIISSPDRISGYRFFRECRG